MQKNTKKKLLAVALAVCLIAILSFTTLAWFNDSESLTNKFEVVTSEDESPDDIFSVDIYEEVDQDKDGTPEKVEDTGAEFTNVVPGDVLQKAPYVENTGRYDQWVRLTITFDCEEAWEAIADGASPLSLLTFYADFDEYWEGGAEETVGDTLVYTYYLKAPLAPGEVVGTFTSVSIPTTLDQNDLYSVKGMDLNISVMAEAVQVENVGATTAAQAFAIVEGTNP